MEKTKSVKEVATKIKDGFTVILNKIKTLAGWIREFKDKQDRKSLDKKRRKV